MSERVHYQFRCPMDLHGQLQSIWNPGVNATDNIVRILRAGVNVIKLQEATHVGDKAAGNTNKNLLQGAINAGNASKNENP